MAKVSPHFSRSEMACKCGCGFDTVDVELIDVLEVIRTLIGPFTPNSVCRCETHNRAVGGSPKSQHLRARAADVPTEDPERLYSFLDNLYPDVFGIGLYDDFVHIDTRSIKARWGNSTSQ